MSDSFASANAPVKLIPGFVLAAFLLAVCVTSGQFLRAMTAQPLSASVLFFISRVLFWLSLAIIYLYVVKTDRQPFLLWQEKNYNVGFYILSILMILLSVIVASVIIGLAIHYSGLNVRSNAVQVLYGFGIPLKLFTVVTASVVEEMIFRGYLIPRLQLFFKRKYWPVIISALVFGLGHMRYGTVVNVTIPVFIGLIFGWYYQKYRNLKILIICHFMIDFSSLLLLHK